MKRRFLRILVAVSLLLTAGSATLCAKGWESVKSERTSTTRVVAKDTEMEVRSGKGLIVVSTSKPVTIKVYSILGQLVSQETLPAGTSYYSVNSHGVFIVKVGNLTCKVSL